VRSLALVQPMMVFVEIPGVSKTCCRLVATAAAYRAVGPDPDPRAKLCLFYAKLCPFLRKTFCNSVDSVWLFKGHQ
jgi:hypothetical protein